MKMKTPRALVLLPVVILWACAAWAGEIETATFLPSQDPVPASQTVTHMDFGRSQTIVAQEAECCQCCQQGICYPSTAIRCEERGGQCRDPISCLNPGRDQ